MCLKGRFGCLWWKAVIGNLASNISSDIVGAGWDRKGVCGGCVCVRGLLLLNYDTSLNCMCYLRGAAVTDGVRVFVDWGCVGIVPFFC